MVSRSRVWIVRTDFVWKLNELAKWFVVSTEVAPSDAIIALGGDVRRFREAVNLYQRGLAPAIWYTGAPLDGESGRDLSVNWVHQALVKNGVPGDVIMHFPSTSTWEDGKQIASASQIHSAKKLIVVTSWYHGRRARFVITHHLKDSNVYVYYRPIGTVGFSVTNWWQNWETARIVIRETAKLGYYWLKYGLRFWDS